MTSGLQQISILQIGRRVAGIAASAVSACAIVIFAPTAASAFDVGGLIGTAIALQMGGYHGSAHRYSARHAAVPREHSSSKHDNGDAPAVERDARDVEVSVQSGKSDGKQKHASVAAPAATMTAQASERDAAASSTAPDDAPAFQPSR